MWEMQVLEPFTDLQTAEAGGSWSSNKCPYSTVGRKEAQGGEWICLTSLSELVGEVRSSSRRPDAKPSGLCFSSHRSVCSLPGSHIGYKFPRHLWLVSPVG